MYGSISVTQHKKYATLQAYKIINDDMGISAGFFRILYNAMKLQNLHSSSIQVTKPEHQIWMNLLQKAERGATVDLSQLPINQYSLLKSTSGLNFIRVVQTLIQSLPDCLLQLFVVKTRCLSCNTIETLITTKNVQSCATCGNRLEIVKYPTLIFQNPQEKISMKSMPLNNELYVLNSIFTAKKEDQQVISYNILIDFQFIQQSEMFILNMIDKSKLRQRAEELTYLKTQKIKEYFSNYNRIQTQINQQCGRPALLCYFCYQHLSRQVQENLQTEMEIKPQVTLEKIQPVQIQPQQLPQIKKIEQPRIRHYDPPEEVREEPVSSPINAKQEVAPPNVREYCWVLYLILGIAALFFLISLIIMTVIYVRLATTITLNGAIVRKSLFLTDAVQGPGDIEPYMSGLSEIPQRFTSHGVQRMQSVNRPSGIYVDMITAQQITANYSLINYLSGMGQYCANYQLNLSQLPQDTVLHVDNLVTNNLTVLNTTNISQQLLLDPSVRTPQLRINGTLTIRRLEMVTGNVNQLVSQNNLNMSTLSMTGYGEVQTFVVEGQITSNLTNCVGPANGTNFTANVIEPGCQYHASGYVQADNCTVDGVAAFATFSNSQFQPDEINFQNVNLTFSGQSLGITDNLTQPTGIFNTNVSTNANFTTSQLQLNSTLTSQLGYANTTTVSGTYTNAVAATVNAADIGVFNIQQSIDVGNGTFVSDAASTRVNTQTIPLTLGRNIQLNQPDQLTFTNGAVSVPYLNIQAQQSIVQNQQLNFTTATANVFNATSMTGSATATSTNLHASNMNTNTMTVDGLAVNTSVTAGSYAIYNNTNRMTVISPCNTGAAQVCGQFTRAWGDQWQVRDGKIENCGGTP